MTMRRLHIRHLGAPGPVGAALLALGLAGVLGLPAASVGAQSGTVFRDGFETDRGWRTFEEVVGPCYGTGIGQVSRSTDVALAGSHSLRVAANAVGSRLSNHLIAHNPVASSPVGGRALMVAWARQEDDRPGSLGETGPEISVQSTKQRSASEFITTVAGVQYLTNPHSPLNGTWQIWRDIGGTPGWVPLMVQPIQRGSWYRLILEADFSAGRYIRFTLQGPGVSRSVNLSTIPLGAENKGFMTEATELTLESENAWSNCGQAPPTTFTVNYDEVVFVA